MNLFFANQGIKCQDVRTMLHAPLIWSVANARNGLGYAHSIYRSHAVHSLGGIKQFRDSAAVRSSTNIQVGF